MIQRLVCKWLRREEKEERMGLFSTRPLVGCCRLQFGHISYFLKDKSMKSADDQMSLPLFHHFIIENYIGINALLKWF